MPPRNLPAARLMNGTMPIDLTTALRLDQKSMYSDGPLSTRMRMRFRGSGLVSPSTCCSFALKRSSALPRSSQSVTRYPLSVTPRCMHVSGACLCCSPLMKTFVSLSANGASVEREK